LEFKFPLLVEKVSSSGGEGQWGKRGRKLTKKKHFARIKEDEKQQEQQSRGREGGTPKGGIAEGRVRKEVSVMGTTRIK